MAVKDSLSLLVSILALALSSYVFVDAKLEASASAKREVAKSAHAAYRLGGKHGAYVVAYLQANVGEPGEIERYREGLLRSMQDTQGYADILDLRIDLSQLFKNYDPKSAFNDDLRAPVSDRIQVVRGADVAAVYEVSFWSIWLEINAQLSIEKGNWPAVYQEFESTGLPHLKQQAEIADLDWNWQSGEPITAAGAVELAQRLRTQLRDRFVKSNDRHLM